MNMKRKFYFFLFHRSSDIGLFQCISFNRLNWNNNIYYSLFSKVQNNQINNQKIKLIPFYYQSKVSSIFCFSFHQIMKDGPSDYQLFLNIPKIFSLPHFESNNINPCKSIKNIIVSCLFSMIITYLWEMLSLLSS